LALINALHRIATLEHRFDTHRHLVLADHGAKSTSMPYWRPT
jgi:hypothetical protein